jgi:hypothetical protein
MPLLKARLEDPFYRNEYYSHTSNLVERIFNNNGKLEARYS